MATFVTLTASAVSFGMVVALVAVGFLVLYKATGVVNFAHGDLVTLGAYLGFWVIHDLRLPIIAGYLVVLVLMFVIGLLIERLAYSPLRRRSLIIIVISTLAAALAIRAVLALWQGSTPKKLPSPVGVGSVRFLGANIPQQNLLIVAVCAVVIMALVVAFQYTSVGRQVRAMASDPEMSQLTGVRERLVSSLAFGASALLAGLAGLLVAPVTSVNLQFGFALLVTAFAASVLGGFGSLIGMVAAGLLIGLAQQLLGGYILRDYATVLPFVLMFGVIVFRPQGLFSTGGGFRL